MVVIDPKRLLLASWYYSTNYSTPLVAATSTTATTLATSSSIRHSISSRLDILPTTVATPE